MINALLLGLLVALAVKRRNGTDTLGAWRFVAAACGACFAYSEWLINLMGSGAAAQAYRGLTWSVLLLPFVAFIIAGLLDAVARKGWTLLFTPVVGGLAGTWLLGALTEQGVFPLALLLDWRLALGVLNGFDLIMAGLCVMGLLMAGIFPQYNRDFARLSVVCVVVYVGLAAMWAWQAHHFGQKYATALELDNPVVRAVPQALSPLNWRVIVVEDNGRVHDTMINLGRSHEPVLSENATRAARVDALYKPRDRAVWRIYRRYGPRELPEEDQRRVRRAWYAWQATPFGWFGRYAVFDAFYQIPDGKQVLACVGFEDLRFDGARNTAKGTWIVCPGRGGEARIFRPHGKPNAEGQWTSSSELVPVLTGNGLNR